MWYCYRLGHDIIETIMLVIGTCVSANITGMFFFLKWLLVYPLLKELEEGMLVLPCLSVCLSLSLWAETYLLWNFSHMWRIHFKFGTCVSHDSLCYIFHFHWNSQMKCFWQFLLGLLCIITTYCLYQSLGICNFSNLIVCTMFEFTFNQISNEIWQRTFCRISKWCNFSECYFPEAPFASCYAGALLIQHSTMI